MNVVAQEPIEKSQPFAVPFRVENSGYFSFRLERAFCYISEVHGREITVLDFPYHDREWDHHTLDRNEAETVLCNVMHVRGVPDSADIAIVLDYRPWQSFPWTFRRYFRFKGAYVDSWQWLKQPSEPIQEAADHAVERLMRKLPDSR